MKNQRDVASPFRCFVTTSVTYVPRSGVGAKWAKKTLLSIHIRDEMRHGISDTPESLPAAVPRVDPQDRLQNGLSCACFIDSGHFHGMLMQLVPS